MEKLAKVSYLVRVASVSGHDYSPAVACCSHGCNMKAFLPFLTDPLERKRFTNFIGLLCILCSCIN